MAHYYVEAKSRRELRAIALSLRETLKLENTSYCPIVELLDIFCVIYDTFSYEIVNDNELETNIHAKTDIENETIYIKQTVYERAVAGEGRDRMTIAHEIGHYFTICQCDFKLYRCYGKKEIATYSDPEWQAKCFAGEFMVPYNLMKDKSVNEIIELCGVSEDAAQIQYKKINDERSG